jgi:hypothetical protein
VLTHVTHRSPRSWAVVSSVAWSTGGGSGRGLARVASYTRDPSGPHHCTKPRLARDADPSPAVALGARAWTHDAGYGAGMAGEVAFRAWRTRDHAGGGLTVGADLTRGAPLPMHGQLLARWARDAGVGVRVIVLPLPIAGVRGRRWGACGRRRRRGRRRRGPRLGA